VRDLDSLAAAPVVHVGGRLAFDGDGVDLESGALGDLPEDEAGLAADRRAQDHLLAQPGSDARDPEALAARVNVDVRASAGRAALGGHGQERRRTEDADRRFPVVHEARRGRSVQRSCSILRA
jgi:hypothetical protein